MRIAESFQLSTLSWLDHALKKKLHKSNPINKKTNTYGTGKYFSEALILESVNPQYDERLFIEFPQKYKFTTCCAQILFWMSKQKQVRRVNSSKDPATNSKNANPNKSLF